LQAALNWLEKTEETDPDNSGLKRREYRNTLEKIKTGTNTMLERTEC